MRGGRFWRIASVALALTCVAGCHKKEQAPSEIPAEPSIEPGSNAAPTTDASFQLMDLDAPTRFAALQDVIVKAGNHCTSVSGAALAGGLEGTDEWRVDCTDSGSWQVWFSDDTGTEVKHCADAKCSE